MCYEWDDIYLVMVWYVMCIGMAEARGRCGTIILFTLKSHLYVLYGRKLEILL